MYTESVEILKPEYGMQGLRLPKKCVYAFLGDIIDEYAIANRALCVWKIHTVTKDFPVYLVEQQGEKIVLCQAPLGASAAAQNMDSLIACGVEKIVCAGSCSHRFSNCGFTLLTDEQPVVSILRYDLCGFICRRNQDISGGRKVFGKSPARRLYLAASMISYR